MTFAYPGETESPVLKDISFKAKPGETIAFIGSTGSGKSSLVNLIQDFMMSHLVKFWLTVLMLETIN